MKTNLSLVYDDHSVHVSAQAESPAVLQEDRFLGVELVLAGQEDERLVCQNHISSGGQAIRLQTTAELGDQITS